MQWTFAVKDEKVNGEIKLEIQIPKVCAVSYLGVASQHPGFLHSEVSYKYAYADVSLLSRYQHVERSTTTLNERTHDTLWFLVHLFLIVMCFYANK